MDFKEKFLEIEKDAKRKKYFREKEMRRGKYPGAYHLFDVIINWLLWFKPLKEKAIEMQDWDEVKRIEKTQLIQLIYALIATIAVLVFVVILIKTL